MLDVIFFVALVVLCLARYNGMCGTCEGSKFGDIFQISLTGLLIIFFVGTIYFVKIALIVLVMSGMRFLAFRPKKEIVKENGKKTVRKERSCCDEYFI